MKYKKILTVDQVKKAINRPYIDPEEWQNFEERCRPFNC